MVNDTHIRKNTSKFAIGDRVRCIEAGAATLLDDRKVYTVDGVDGELVTLQGLSTPGVGFYMERFVKAPAQETPARPGEFAEGDFVKCISEGQWDGKPILPGEVVKVASVAPQSSIFTDTAGRKFWMWGFMKVDRPAADKAPAPKSLNGDQIRAALDKAVRTIPGEEWVGDAEDTRWSRGTIVAFLRAFADAVEG